MKKSSMKVSLCLLVGAALAQKGLPTPEKGAPTDGKGSGNDVPQDVQDAQDRCMYWGDCDDWTKCFDGDGNKKDECLDWYKDECEDDDEDCQQYYSEECDYDPTMCDNYYNQDYDDCEMYGDCPYDDYECEETCDQQYPDYYYDYPDYDYQDDPYNNYDYDGADAGADPNGAEQYPVDDGPYDPKDYADEYPYPDEYPQDGYGYDQYGDYGFEYGDYGYEYQYEQCLDDCYDKEYQDYGDGSDGSGFDKCTTMASSKGCDGSDNYDTYDSDTLDCFTDLSTGFLKCMARAMNVTASSLNGDEFDDLTPEQQQMTATCLVKTDFETSDGDTIAACYGTAMTMQLAMEKCGVNDCANDDTCSDKLNQCVCDDPAGPQRQDAQVNGPRRLQGGTKGRPQPDPTRQAGGKPGQGGNPPDDEMREIICEIKACANSDDAQVAKMGTCMLTALKGVIGGGKGGNGGKGGGGPQKSCQFEDMGGSFCSDPTVGGGGDMCRNKNMQQFCQQTCCLQNQRQQRRLLN